MIQCAECGERVILVNDYICTECRHVKEPLPRMRPEVARLIDLTLQLNRRHVDEWPHLYVMVKNQEDTPWIFIELCEREESNFHSFDHMYMITVKREFAIWREGADIYEVKHGEVGDDPIPEAEYRKILTLPLDKY